MIPREQNHKVTIIVVNWNGEKFLQDCLGALSNQSYADCEIILVDNGSADKSVHFTRENFPAAKIVALEENKGFTGGNVTMLSVTRRCIITFEPEEIPPRQRLADPVL
jgi:GT2 family glycosyltransferase